MADPFAQFTSGVPPVGSVAGRRMFEQNPMDSGLRAGMARNRMAAQSSILETQNRIEQFRQANRSRQQAPQVMGALSQLDPLNDPEYDRKVMGILSQAPDATLDKTVANFLDVQGGIFSRAQQERDWQSRAETTFKQQDAMTRLRGDYAETARKQRAEMERAKAINDRFDSLPLPYRQSAAQMAQETGDPETAIASAEIQAERDAAVNKLRSEGFTDEEIFGTTAEFGPPKSTGVIRAGMVDPNKASALIGAKKRAKEAEADAPKPVNERDAIKDELTLMNDLFRMREAAGQLPDDDPIKDAYKQRIGEMESKLGLQPKASGASVPAAGGTSQPAPRTAASFFPPPKSK